MNEGIAETAGELIALPNRLPATLELALLPWEQADELLALLGGLLAEFTPRAPTEQHLVEQLALAMWRKRRVAQAERALHLASLRRDALGYDSNTIATSALVSTGQVPDGVSVSKALHGSPSRDAEELVDIETDEAMTTRALAILREGGRNAYSRALAALRSDTRDWWDEHLAGNAVPNDETDDEEQVPKQWNPTAADLQRFLEEVIVPIYEQGRAQLRCNAAIRQQAYGQSLDPDRASKLQAYDLRLDRQLERTLGMLLKLQTEFAVP